MPLKATSHNPLVEPLGRITDLWLDPKSPIRLKAVEALQVSTGYDARMIQRALENAFGELSRQKLIDFIRDERIPFHSGSKAVVLHIAAGNVFTAWLHGTVITLLLGHRCWVKPSSQEPVFAQLWRESVRMIDLTIGDRITIVPWSEDLLGKSSAVVAYGTDETLASLRKKTSPEARFVGYGHKASVAIVFRESSLPEEWPRWRDLAVADSDLFELNGCLSPQVIYVEGESEGVWKNLQVILQPAPLLRPFVRLEEVLRDLTRLEGHLSCVGYAGPESRLEPVRRDLENLGVTRICELGQMQRPPLTWRNGGISLAGELRDLVAASGPNP